MEQDNTFEWGFTEPEKKWLKEASLKLFKPTIKCIEEFTEGGNFKIELIYEVEGEIVKQRYTVNLEHTKESGIKFKVTLPKILNVGSVMYSRSYGLDDELRLFKNGRIYYINENSVKDFNTGFPTKPQILKGSFIHFRSFKKDLKKSHWRQFVPVSGADMTYPTDILSRDKNHMRFDISKWDRQKTLMGFPMMTSKGMYVELEIDNHVFHFYALEPLKALIIDSQSRLSLADFKRITSAIRLCFALLSGKYYRDEVVNLGSKSSNFESIEKLEYQVEEPSIITKNQVVDHELFFSHFEEQTEQIKKEWADFHTFFPKGVFAALCKGVLESTQLKRSIELLINAGNIDDVVQKGALYAVSLESVTEYLKDDFGDALKPIQDKPIWTKLLRTLRIEIEQIKESIGQEGYNILNSKIDTLNSPTNRNKLIRSFELLGILLDDIDKQSLQHRNDYLHGDEPDNRDWVVKSLINAFNLHTLITMLILKKFGYSGHVISQAARNLLSNKEAQDLLKNPDLEGMTQAFEYLKTRELPEPKDIKDTIEQLGRFEKLGFIVLEIERMFRII